MTSLSLLIYFVGLSETISSYFGWIIFVLAVLSIIFTIIRLVVICNPNDRDCIAVDQKYGTSIKHWATCCYTLLAISIFVQFIFPSKQTAVLIAASEVGQRVLQTQQAQAVGQRVGTLLDGSTDLLQVWIKKETFNQQKQLDELVTSKSSNSK